MIMINDCYDAIIVVYHLEHHHHHHVIFVSYHITSRCYVISIYLDNIQYSTYTHTKFANIWVYIKCNLLVLTCDDNFGGNTPINA